MLRQKLLSFSTFVEWLRPTHRNAGYADFSLDFDYPGLISQGGVFLGVSVLGGFEGTPKGRRNPVWAFETIPLWHPLLVTRGVLPVTIAGVKGLQGCLCGESGEELGGLQEGHCELLPW